MSTTNCEIQKLRDVATLGKGKPPVQQPYFGQDAELYLTPEYLRRRGTAEPVKASVNAVRVLDGDTIVLWDGSNAGEFFSARRGILASTMSLISHDDTFDKEYFFYAVKHWESFLKGQTSGSGIPHVDKEVLGKIEVFKFLKPEQTKIAEILSTVDQAIEQTEALIAKQQRIKTGLMQDLLTRGIDEHSKLRSEQTHEFKDSTLGRIPVEWEVKELSEVVDKGITYGIVQAGPHVDDDGVPYIRTGDMSGDTIEVKYLLRTSRNIAKYFKRSEVHVGDIVFALRATVGKVLPVLLEFDGANLTQGTAKISPKQSIDSNYLLWALRTSCIQNQIRLYQKGTTFMEITLGDLRSLKIALPVNQDEQSRISALLSKQDKLRLDYVSNLQKLLSLKTALMQDLLTGKKRVTALLNDTEEITL